MIAERTISAAPSDSGDDAHGAWPAWIDLYCRTWCVGRNLQPGTMAAYRQTLWQFTLWLEEAHPVLEPGKVTTRMVLDYVVHLREHRGNGDSAVLRAVVVLKNFYRAMAALGHLAAEKDPMNGFPKMKPGCRRLPAFLSEQEVRRLLEAPPSQTQLELRDRALVTLLYATGIRASECAGLLEEWVDLDARTIRVLGKGNRERVICLNARAVEALQAYRVARGPQSPQEAFFRSKSGGPINRKIVYERVKKCASEAGIAKRVTPHTLRHTCATHLVQHDVNLVVIRDLLGHRQITSTQIYLHTTARDLRDLAANHPVGRLAPTVAALLEGVRIPIDHAPVRGRESGTVSGATSPAGRGAG